ncbi:MAG: hypothetical protein KBT82_14355 [Marinobacter sp.]|uniref:hypothetical protein n=1 Tax=Marinobacter sp. TaxID=50741 RepID=UPI001B6EAF5D|nr:hypothetical protein [Marinobacter sp.]MBQ0747357.1 hypothetical protein [Marinobacter sp.]MBQ0815333.1 hypothetical protein [Marinobacter sp.]
MAVVMAAYGGLARLREGHLPVVAGVAAHIHADAGVKAAVLAEVGHGEGVGGAFKRACAATARWTGYGEAGSYAEPTATARRTSC